MVQKNKKTKKTDWTKQKSDNKIKKRTSRSKPIADELKAMSVIPQQVDIENALPQNYRMIELTIITILSLLGSRTTIEDLKKQTKIFARHFLSGFIAPAPFVFIFWHIAIYGWRKFIPEGQSYSEISVSNHKMVLLVVTLFCASILTIAVPSIKKTMTTAPSKKAFAEMAESEQGPRCGCVHCSPNPPSNRADTPIKKKRNRMDTDATIDHLWATLGKKEDKQKYFSINEKKNARNLRA